MTQAVKRYEVESYKNDGTVMNNYKFDGGGAARQAEAKFNEIRRAGRKAKLRREVFKDGRWLEEAVVT